MAFNKNNFAPVGGQSARGSAPQIFTYSTSDNKTAVETSGYFNDARTYFKVVESGALKYKGSLGTVTTLGAA